MKSNPVGTLVPMLGIVVALCAWLFPFQPIRPSPFDNTANVTLTPHESPARTTIAGSRDSEPTHPIQSEKGEVSLSVNSSRSDKSLELATNKLRETQGSGTGRMTVDEVIRELRLTSKIAAYRSTYSKEPDDAELDKMVDEVLKNKAP